MTKSNTTKPKIVKCRYSHCLHETKELNAEDSMKQGSAYYHKDCFKTKDDIQRIIKLFSERANQNVVYAQLFKTVNNIIFEKGISSDFLLFSMNHWLNAGHQLNYPGGLYYVIQDKSAQSEYKRLQNLKLMDQQKDAFEIHDSTESKFEYKPNNRISGFEAILGK